MMDLGNSNQKQSLNQNMPHHQTKNKDKDVEGRKRRLFPKALLRLLFLLLKKILKRELKN